MNQAIEDQSTFQRIEEESKQSFSEESSNLEGVGPPNIEKEDP